MNPELQSLVSDIAVAMFKVSSIIRHATLRAELENKAIYLVSNPNSDTIINIANLIVVSREIGEIKSSNAAILIRELERLRKGLLISPAVEEMDISSQFIQNNSDTNDAAPLPAPSTNALPPSLAIKTENYNPYPSSDKTTSPPAFTKSFFNPDKVYQYIAARKGTRLKELESIFNAVSGRTIRRITDSLIKEGKIERVGNPGPTSFYRASTVSASDKQQISLREIPQSGTTSEKPPFINEQEKSPISQDFAIQNNPQSTTDKNQAPTSTVPAPATPTLAAPTPTTSTPTLISAPVSTPTIAPLTPSTPSTLLSSPAEAFKHLSF